MGRTLTSNLHNSEAVERSISKFRDISNFDVSKLCLYMVDIFARTAFYFSYFGSFFLVSFMFQLISAFLSSFTNF